MLHRLRSAAVVGGLWGAVWLAAGMLLGWPLHWFGFPSLERSITVLGVWTALGALSGLIFASLLAWRERGHTVDTLRPSRLVLWGIVAGAGVPLALCLVLVLALPHSYFTLGSGGMFAIMAAVGAASALVTLRLAHAAPAAVPSVPPST